MTEYAQVSKHRSFVRGVDGIRRLASRAVQVVVPFSGNFSTTWNLDDSLGDGLAIWIDATVANNVLGVDVLDRLEKTRFQVRKLRFK